MAKKFSTEINETARNVAIQKLEDQGIDYRDLCDVDFNDFVNIRKEILRKDIKKVGAVTAISLALSLITGGI